MPGPPPGGGPPIPGPGPRRRICPSCAIASGASAATVNATSPAAREVFILLVIAKISLPYETGLLRQGRGADVKKL
jgi:hypothetical protein